MSIGGFPFGETPCVLYDDNGNAVLPALSYLDGGEHVNIQPWDHALIHQGKTYTFGQYVENLVNNGIINLALEASGTKNLHTYFTLSSEGKGIVDYLRQVTTITGGTTLSPRNKHGSFSDAPVSVATATLDPTTITGGTLMPRLLIPGGSGGLTAGATSTNRDEWVISSGQIGVFSFTNTAGVAKDVSFNILFYESDE